MKRSSLSKISLTAIAATSAVFADDSPVSVYADFLCLKRNCVEPTKIAVQDQTTTGGTMLTTEVLTNELLWEPGVRGGIKAQFGEKYGMDVNFIYVAQWHAQSSRALDKQVTFPFTTYGYDQDFTQANQMTADYKSRLRQFEANGLYFMTPRWENYFSVSTVFGAKTMLIREEFDIAYDKPPAISHYLVQTKNIVTVAQVGMIFQMRPTPEFAWELTLKAGLGFNAAHQHTFLGDANDQVVLRDFDSKKYKSAVTGDGYARATYRPNESWEFYAGYMLLYAAGVALAPEQIDLNTNTNSGEEVIASGNFLAHGAVVGITANF